MMDGTLKVHKLCAGCWTSHQRQQLSPKQHLVEAKDGSGLMKSVALETRIPYLNAIIRAGEIMTVTTVRTQEWYAAQHQVSTLPQTNKIQISYFFLFRSRQTFDLWILSTSSTKVSKSKERVNGLSPTPTPTSKKERKKERKKEKNGFGGFFGNNPNVMFSLTMTRPIIMFLEPPCF